MKELEELLHFINGAYHASTMYIVSGTNVLGTIRDKLAEIIESIKNSEPYTVKAGSINPEDIESMKSASGYVIPNEMPIE